MKALSAFLILCFASLGNAKTFVYCSEGSPSTFNPQMASDGTTFNASSRTIYNRLVDFKQGSTEIIPSLATTWKVSGDGLHYTFQLRKGVKFHSNENFTSTREFNANDVLFSFNRMRLKDHPYHKVNGGNYEYFESMEMGSLVKEIKKINDYEIEFILAKPEAPFLANMAMDFASILSEEYSAKLAKEKKEVEIDTHPIGTGPFVLKKYVKDNIIRYEAHPEYFEGKASIDKLVFTITQDPSVRFQKLKTGECNFVAYPAPTDLEKMRADKNITVLEEAGLNVGYIAMNVQKAPLNNPLVRQAIHHALNRSSYIAAIYLNNAEVAKNPIPPTMWSYNDTVKDYEYSPQKAKELLKKTGFEKGLELELWTLPVSRPYNPNGKKMGELIQADLKEVGINLKLISFDWPTYLSKARTGEHQMIQMGWTGDNGDPDNFLSVLLGCGSIEGGSNYARWCDKEFVSHIDQAKRITVQSQRAIHYLKAQEIFKKSAPWVTLAHAKVYRAMSKNVVGYKISPFGADTFYGVDLK